MERSYPRSELNLRCVDSRPPGMDPDMVRRYAWRWALTGFIVTIVHGQVLSAGFDATLRAALLSLTAGYGLGLLCGVLWQEAFE